MVARWLHDSFDLNFYMLHFAYNFIMISTSNTCTIHSSSIQNYPFQESRGVDSDKNNSEATEEFGPQIQDGGMTKQVEEESTMALNVVEVGVSNKQQNSQDNQRVPLPLPLFPAVDKGEKLFTKLEP